MPGVAAPSIALTRRHGVSRRDLAQFFRRGLHAAGAAGLVELALEALLLPPRVAARAGEQVEHHRRDEERGEGRERQPADHHPAQRLPRLDPAPPVRISGRPPRMVAIIVITTGRSRMTLALRIASRTDWPWSRSWLANSTIRMPFLAIRPTSRISPIWL